MTDKANHSSAAAGRYIYAIVSDQGQQSLGPIGLEGAEVYTIADAGVAAVVSNLKAARIRPQRRNMAAHQEVLKLLLQTVTPLPTAFGLVADDDAGLLRILRDNHAVFVDQLQRVKDCVEMGLRVAWDVPNIFEYFVTAHPQLQELRDDFFSGGGNLTQDQMITLGSRFGALLEEDREAYTEQVETVMHTCCRELKRNKCRSETEVMNLACLVRRDDLQRFEETVGKAADPFDDNYAFDFTGPWAPHNFVEMDIHL